MEMLWRITPYLEELDKMIGMKTLKESIFYQILYYLQGLHNRNQNEEYLHTIIMGAPGTGKTSISKIIGQIYREMGVLSDKGPFKVAYRDDFVAEYLGQTAVKTRKLLESCIGGVLFIDELYALGPGKDDKDSFSKEALDTLPAFLSEHKNDFCCIAAGYEEDIKNCFFSMNKGLERRFPWVHVIEEYTSEELTQIAIKMIKEMNWEIGTSETNVTEIIEKNRKFFKNAGGDIETFLSKCKMVHAKRVFSLDKCHKGVFTKYDFQEGIDMLKKYRVEEKDTSPPLGMYL
jgi:stage V sporulation protein K